MRYLSSLHFPGAIWKIETLQRLPGVDAPLSSSSGDLIGVRSRQKPNFGFCYGQWGGGVLNGVPTFACWWNRLICIMLLVLLGCRCDRRWRGREERNCTSRESKTAGIRARARRVQDKNRLKSPGCLAGANFFFGLFHIFFSTVNLFFQEPQFTYAIFVINSLMWDYIRKFMFVIKCKKKFFVYFFSVTCQHKKMLFSFACCIMKRYYRSYLCIRLIASSYAREFCQKQWQRRQKILYHRIDIALKREYNPRNRRERILNDGHVPAICITRIRNTGNLFVKRAISSLNHSLPWTVSDD